LGSSRKKKRYSAKGINLFNEDVSRIYDSWESPVVIVSDGAYGLGLFDGDPPSPKKIPGWYEPHVKIWSEKATFQTTLWLWITEIGWVYLHPLLERNGWKYIHANTWDKGMGHVAGRCNTGTMRMFPVVSELCVHYVREVKIRGNSLQEWLRSEWKRSGLPLSEANVACGVKNAATRKYLAADQWYAPPIESLVKIIEYANDHSDASGRPYYIFDESLPVKEWNETNRKSFQRHWNDFLKVYRSKFHCPMGITNVWNNPPLHGKRERVKKKDGGYVHLNQKPLKIIKMLVEASSDPGDVTWEPFGGLCTTAVACYHSGRKCYSAEINEKYYRLAVDRLSKEISQERLKIIKSLDDYTSGTG
jgi:site-specific DNA-methyltransferase (adenine-specific)